MCVGCQEMKAKKELIRIVKTPEDTIELDPTGKKNGRGAYICLNVDCLKKAIKAKRLEKAFQQRIEPEVLQQLSERLVSQ
jgi:predicted RNA-binding protein YlxR (DUF448 family)